MVYVYSRGFLLGLRRRAIRRKVWYGLDPLDRGILGLVTRVVDRVESALLGSVLVGIVKRLRDALKSEFARLMEAEGFRMAWEAAGRATEWGSGVAGEWAQNARLGRGGKGFYLGYRTLFLTDIEGFPLGHVEAPANVNEKQLVEELLTRVLGESLEVELLAADSQFESQGVFELLESLKIGGVIAWRRMRGRENPPGVLTVKDRIDVEGPEWMRVVYKRLRAVVEGFNGRAKSRLAYGRLTWQGLGNASIHVGLVLMVAYAVAIAASRIDRPELRQSVAFFA